MSEADMALIWLRSRGHQAERSDWFLFIVDGREITFEQLMSITREMWS